MLNPVLHKNLTDKAICLNEACRENCVADIRKCHKDLGKCVIESNLSGMFTDFQTEKEVSSPLICFISQYMKMVLDLSSQGLQELVTG